MKKNKEVAKKLTLEKMKVAVISDSKSIKGKGGLVIKTSNKLH